MTPHIKAQKQEIAKLVIMPGDPKRADYIAKNYLTDYKLVSDVRAIPVYTGIYNGKKVTVIASGMGMPSMAIYAYELFNFYEVDKIIRVGTCGSLKEDINLNDVLLSKTAYTDSNITTSIDNNLINSIEASNELNNKVLDLSSLENIDIKLSNIYTTDIFYRETYDFSYDAVEMETFILLYLAKKFNKDATSLLTVSDSILSKEKLSPEEREKSLDNAIKIALKSL